MAKDMFRRYIWLVDTIYRAGKITFEEINDKWQRSPLGDGEELPLRTFHNHRAAIEDMFDINILCDKRDGYKYYIENADDIEKGGVRSWLLNTFAVNNLINESHHIKHRILFESIPSGQNYLAPLIEAMRDGVTVEITYRNFWKEKEATFEVEPYCVKVFRQRWYLVARNIGFDALRIYSLDRILGLRQTDNRFSYPQDFDPEGYFYNSFGIIVDEDYPAQTVRIKAYGTKAKYIRSLPLHHSQNEVETGDDYAVFEYFLSPSYDFRQEILSHGDEVEVLAPESLRQSVLKIARNIETTYSR